MGNDKRKRKSAGGIGVEPAKERRLADDYPSWKDHSGYTVLQLADQQSVVFVGEATLQVLHGAVRVSGKLITVESPPLTLSTGGRFSLAIAITAEAVVTQVPLAASPVVEVALQSRPMLPQQQPQQQQQQFGKQTTQQQQLIRAGFGAGAGGGNNGSAGPGGPTATATATTTTTTTASGCCTFTLHRTNDPRSPPSLVVSPQWAQALDGVCAAAASGIPIVLAVLGAKGMGKSSLARLATNRLLDEAPVVAFLDTDVGQTEFTPPGLLSMHLLEPGQPVVGPPHAHARQPWASRFVGDVSPQHDPQLYLSAVQALYGTYWNWAQEIVAEGGLWPPLIVNTHGWVKGLGFDLLTQLLRILAPTHVVQIRGGAERKNLPRGAFWSDPRSDDTAAATAPAELICLESLADTTAQQPQGPQPRQQQSGPGTADGGGGGGVGGGFVTSSGGGGGSAAAAAGERGEASGSVRQRGGGPGPVVSPKALKPVESRALTWHAWAKRVVGGEPAWGSYESEDFWRNAGALASLAPWRVSLDDLHVQLLAGSLAQSQLGRLLNGAVVGLLATQPPPPPPPPPARSSGRTAKAGRRRQADAAGGAAVPSAMWGLDVAAASAAFPPGRLSYVGSSSVPPPLLPCVGLGIVRAVDLASRSVYVLTDVAAEVLECVGVLVVGRLELPGSLVVGGEVAWPYQQLFGLSAEATGAGAGKARKNLSRSSLVEMAG